MSAEEAAEKFPRNVTIGASGFTLAGYPKVIPAAFAKRIENSNAKEEFSINLFTGASTGDELDGVLARTGRMKLRIPYQSHPDMRKLINQGKLNYLDMHLSHVRRFIREGIFPSIDVALIEACDVTADGRVYLTNSSGMSGTYLSLAKEIFIELNVKHPLEMKGLHDIYIPELHSGKPINIDYVDDRIGWFLFFSSSEFSLNCLGRPYVRVNPEKIKGIVLTDVFESSKGKDQLIERRFFVSRLFIAFKQPDETSFKIANNILDFILHEVDHGRMPKKLLPFQSGVGNVANAVLAVIGKSIN